ncbi:M48 family metallopeptidase [Defluviimonas sp. WL0002]|uniref:M48 family metallopeptidase n=1 Tax=Albidovulum marisflavi TaxID=2984159 RepID=A0ABT2ZES3_9RHOB|nr:M48 family metallopeptidase [Defluviimonas sp. WL0002]MCV2869586.1 M48 family metallopeptidase [Defluviimonas sp. WL0002]
MRRHPGSLSLIFALMLSACVGMQDETSYPIAPVAPAGPPLDAATAQANFAEVLARMEPVIENECRTRTRGLNCDYRISVDARPGLPPNALQTRDGAGRPVIAFTSSLIAEARNRDELAFVMGHEAAHHIADHIPRQRQTTMAGAMFGGLAATFVGASQSTVELAQNLGATVGSRVYSKDHEIEADGLGTVLTCAAGYSARRGAAYFARIPDPGNRFLGSHPPNGQRIATVERISGDIGCP